MGTRVLSLWLPYLAIDRRNQEKSRQSNLPRATCREEIDGRPLVALCPKAERAGLQPGMSSADALQRVQGLRIHPSEPTRDRQFLETCAAWCERHTPFVAIDRSFPDQKGGALWLDIGSTCPSRRRRSELACRPARPVQEKGDRCEGGDRRSSRQRLGGLPFRP